MMNESEGGPKGVSTLTSSTPVNSGIWYKPLPPIMPTRTPAAVLIEALCPLHDRESGLTLHSIDKVVHPDRGKTSRANFRAVPAATTSSWPREFRPDKGRIP